MFIIFITPTTLSSEISRYWNKNKKLKKRLADGWICYYTFVEMMNDLILIVNFGTYTMQFKDVIPLNLSQLFSLHGFQ